MGQTQFVNSTLGFLIAMSLRSGIFVGFIERGCELLCMWFKKFFLRPQQAQYRGRGGVGRGGVFLCFCVIIISGSVTGYVYVLMIRIIPDQAQ